MKDHVGTVFHEYLQILGDTPEINVVVWGMTDNVGLPLVDYVRVYLTMCHNVGLSRWSHRNRSYGNNNPHFVSFWNWNSWVGLRKIETGLTW